MKGLYLFDPTPIKHAIELSVVHAEKLFSQMTKEHETLKHFSSWVEGTMSIFKFYHILRKTFFLFCILEKS